MQLNIILIASLLSAAASGLVIPPRYTERESDLESRSGRGGKYTGAPKPIRLMAEKKPVPIMKTYNVLEGGGKPAREPLFFP